MESWKFRVAAKGWFLTYPKCSLTKEEALEALKGKRKGLKQVLVAREVHQDGTPHLHAYLYYDRTFDCTNERFFDLGSFHPNVQSAKSLRAVQAYIKKDGDYVQEGMDYAAEVAAIQDHKAYLGKRLIDGESLTDLVKDHPELVFKYRQIKENVEAYRRDLIPTLPRCLDFIPNTWEKILLIKESKQRHYWIWSSGPNKGKTEFLKKIADSYPSMWYSYVEVFQSASSFAQFVLLDEYTKAHLTVTQLNQMCDGTYQYPVKGGSPVQLSTPILIVCANKPPEEVYTDPKNHPLINARFCVIDLS